MLKSITSPQNPFIKNIIALSSKSRDRREQGCFISEGWRETGLALRSGYEVQSLLFDERFTPVETVHKWLGEHQLPGAGQLELISVSTPVFEKIAYRTGISNVVAVVGMRETSPERLHLPEKPLLLVMESVEKPGNLGAMLRTADAAGVDAVFVCDPHTDIYNPNAVRASLGAIFTVPVLALSSAEALSFFKNRRIQVLVTALTASTLLYDCDLTQGLAFVVGAEAGGVTDFWLENADERVIIPMQGVVDSLNVSNAAAIVLFEAVRQRRPA